MSGVEERAMVTRENADIAALGDVTKQWRNSYLDALKAELREVIEEIRTMIEVCRTREECGEITNYVRWQNTALFIREIEGLSTLLKELYTTNPHRFRTHGEMVQYINAMFERSIIKYDFPRAIHHVVKSKLAVASASTFGLQKEKVEQYAAV